MMPAVMEHPGAKDFEEGTFVQMELGEEELAEEAGPGLEGFATEEPVQEEPGLEGSAAEEPGLEELERGGFAA